MGPGIKAEPDQLTHIDALRIRLAEADGFVVVTPEYNRSYPASLKKAIDQYNVEWRAKPVAFVSYGGISGGLRAVEHLRNVFAELHAVTVRTAVCVSELWKHFDHTGAFSLLPLPQPSRTCCLNCAGGQIACGTPVNKRPTLNERRYHQGARNVVRTS